MQIEAMCFRQTEVCWQHLCRFMKLEWMHLRLMPKNLKKISEAFPWSFQKCWENQLQNGKIKYENPELTKTDTYLLPENWGILNI